MEFKKVLSLKPTQFSIGFYEVDKKMEKISKMNDKELQRYLDEHPVPVIVGPNNLFYMIDRHHLVRAAWELRISEVVVDIKADLSHLDGGEFWEVMKKAKWVYLFDQFGNGPHGEEKLPWDIRRMSDDPYRSLAWMLREQKVFTKVNRPYSEFVWANFFRDKIKIENTEKGLKQATQSAIEMVKNKLKGVEDLPGFNK